MFKSLHAKYISFRNLVKYSNISFGHGVTFVYKRENIPLVKNVLIIILTFYVDVDFFFHLKNIHYQSQGQI